MSRAIGSCIDGDEERLRTSLELFAIAGGVNAALDFWNVFLFTFVQNRIVRRLRSTLFQKILGQEIGYFDEVREGREAESGSSPEASPDARQASPGLAG